MATSQSFLRAKNLALSEKACNFALAFREELNVEYDILRKHQFLRTIYGAPAKFDVEFLL